MKLYENYIKALGLKPDEIPHSIEEDFACFGTRGSLVLPDNTTREIRYVSFHPDHTDGPCAKLMVESGEVVWTKDIKLV